MKGKKRNPVEWAMHYHKIAILAVCCLIAFGIYSLPQMRKNEFPDFTVRQGLVVAVAPGNTAKEMAEQVAKPLENYIFSYKEVKKAKTFSQSRDGIVYIQVELNDELNDKDGFWSKFKHGIDNFKSQLPSNVLAVQVLDDFGDTSALLLAMESRDKTYPELDDYMDGLQDRLRRIPSVGRLSVSGLRKEQITVELDPARLSQYGLDEQAIAITLLTKGFATSGGRVKNPTYTHPIHVTRSFNNEFEIGQQIIYTDPAGNNIRLRDVARIRREYPDPDSYIEYNGVKCLLLSVEMKQGKNIVKMGEDVHQAIEDIRQTLPSDVEIYSITDQSRVVSDSVSNFLHELVIAIVAVILVVILLLPLRVALVAASTIPITIFISLGLFYAFGIELNTVTLAALITTLGMIVDNSIVIIDCYLEKLGEGCSRWHASIESATHFFKSILSATLAISITFFPFLFTTTGMIHDFLTSFPWAITLILAISLLVAVFFVPFLQFWFIRQPLQPKSPAPNGKRRGSFLETMQRFYDRALHTCLAHPKVTLACGLLSVVAGATLLFNRPLQIMPNADRNQFAVEISLPTGSSVQATASVADSMARILRQDPRVQSVASFVGCSSPRFQTSYAPQIAGTNYAQFIVNTSGPQETVALLDEYAPKYTNHFPQATVRFKQLSYSQAVYPIEIRLSSQESPDSLKRYADEIAALLRQMPEIAFVRTDALEPLSAISIILHEDEASRLGITNTGVETTMALRYGSGLAVAKIWEGDDDTPVVLRSNKADSARNTDPANELIPAFGGLAHVPLRQVADIVPSWQEGQIVRRNGVRCITIQADVTRGTNIMAATARVQEAIDNRLKLPPQINLTYAGEKEQNSENLPFIINGLAIAAAIIFFILLLHYKRISVAFLIFSSMALCLLGAGLGLLASGLSLSITCFLGLVSLMGIIVRNGIIMIDFAEELRQNGHMNVSEAIEHSASRRMRPIFLTSAAASMGVIPMILGKSSLWMPMGTVIFYGTLLTLVFILSVLPAAYLLFFRRSTRERAKAQTLETL